MDLETQKWAESSRSRYPVILVQGAETPDAQWVEILPLISFLHYLAPWLPRYRVTLAARGKQWEPTGGKVRGRETTFYFPKAIVSKLGPNPFLFFFHLCPPTSWPQIQYNHGSSWFLGRRPRRGAPRSKTSNGNITEKELIGKVNLQNSLRSPGLTSDLHIHGFDPNSLRDPKRLWELS